MEVIIFSDLDSVGFFRYSGAYRIATELRQNGFSVQVIDFFNDLELPELSQLLKQMITKQTLFVGFASTFLAQQVHSESESYLVHRRPASWYGELATMIRKLNPRTKIVIGGVHAALLQFPEWIDFWVKGIADRGVVALAKHLKVGEALQSHPVPQSQGRVIDCDKDYPFEHFSTSRIDWDTRDNIFKNELLPIEVARGCAFRCAFCAYRNGKNPDDYLKSVEVLQDEFLRNHLRFGVSNYMVCDDNFNDSIEKVRRFHQISTSLPFRLRYISFNRVDIFKRYPEMRELLFEAGQLGSLFGIETFNHKTGLRVGKGLPPDETKKLLHFLKDLWQDEVQIGASFIVGLPDEDRDSIKRTVDWLTGPNCPIDSFIFFPLNFVPDNNQTEIQKNPQKYGYDIYGTGRYEWKNQYFTGDEAKELAAEIMRSTSQTNKMGPFGYPAFHNLGFSQKEIFAKTFLDGVYPTHDMQLKRAQLKAEYMQNLTRLYGKPSLLHSVRSVANRFFNSPRMENSL